MTNGVFSDFSIDQMGFKFTGETSATYQSVNCVGALEETMNSKIVTKKCRGVVIKTRTRGDGTGELKITAHIPWAVYTDVYGMKLDSLIEGVVAYGRNSIHKEFAIVLHVEDEDGVEKFKAYPNCMVTTGKTAKTENGAEEVAEIELTVAVMPDEYGNGVYEAIDTELTDTTIKNQWMTAFTPSMVQAVSA